MFRQKFILILVACIALIALIQNGPTFLENRKLDRYLADDGFHAYAYDQFDESSFALFTNEDETLVGLAEMSGDGYGAATVEPLEAAPFDYIELKHEDTYYWGVRLNNNPQKVASLRIIGERMQGEHVLNRPEEDAFSKYHILKLHNVPQEDWTIQTLDQNGQVIDSIDL
ncbi:hypothetical protein [Exiguobacterium aurantiacum]|uniref:hypothetical protein n=1 Tax=Exiguobacterium aurantiacum TaxID=33987 RepID=UPI001E53950A|nr:hypothetical protein [Exiguobacterium aurantiacum]